MNISELRSETSRINGAKSKGPVTPEGRAKSAQNNNRYGLTIRGLKLHTESDEAVALVLGEYEEQHQPAGPIEHEMVEMLASYQFLLIRAMAMQTGYLEVAIARHEKDIDGEFDEISANGFMAEVFRRMAKDDDSYRLLLRHTAGLRRAYNQKLKELQALQTRRTSESAPLQVEPEPAAGPPKAELQVEPELRTAAIPRVGRNTLCPCGSGVKYKRCCIGKPQPSPIPVAA